MITRTLRPLYFCAGTPHLRADPRRRTLDLEVLRIHLDGAPEPSGTTAHRVLDHDRRRRRTLIAVNDQHGRGSIGTVSGAAASAPRADASNAAEKAAPKLQRVRVTREQPSSERQEVRVH